MEKNLRLVTKGIKCFPIVYLKIQLLQRFSLNPIPPFHKFLLIVFQFFLDVFSKFSLVSKVFNFQECPMYEKYTSKVFMKGIRFSLKKLCDIF